MEFSNMFNEAAEVARQAMEPVFSGELPGEVMPAASLEGALPGAAAEASPLTGELPAAETVTPTEITVETVQVEAVEMRTINSGLEGGRHGVTDVPYLRREIALPDGSEAVGVFPEFDAKFETRIPEDMYMKSDREQFGYCTEQLREAAETNPEVRSRFNDMQLEQIRNGDTPDGYIWHHHEEPGRMQLVDEYDHAKSAHTGGRSLWGGGSEMRGAYNNGVPA